MEPLRFQYHIKKEQEGTYFAIPFDVPDGVTAMTVAYHYLRPTKGLMGDLHPTNTVDFGLQDEKGRFLGWSGSAKDQVKIGEYGSSAGYPIMPIRPGTWSILVGAYHVADGGVDVNYSVCFESKHKSLLFGDLHTHSTVSDGAYDRDALGRKGKEAGLDFMAFADHNNSVGNDCLPKISDMTFIPAVEWTHYKGHMNFFGVAEPFENSFIANTEQEMRDLIRKARARGAVISVNHPKCPFCPYLWEDTEAFELVEIWNGPMTARTVKAVEWWTTLLKEGRRVRIVGGSDFHKDKGLVRLGHPVTAVYAESRSAADILRAVKNGNSFVTSGIDGPRLRIFSEDADMGDETALSQITATGENMGGASLVLVTEQGETVIGRHIKKPFEHAQTVRDSCFAYIKAVKTVFGKEHILAVSNPIFMKK